MVNKKILIFDGEEDNRTTINKTLELDGYKTEFAISVDDCL